MKLTKKAEKALKKSIAHWERLTAGEPRFGENHGSGCCELCEVYQDGDEPCRRCPIRQKTGLEYCHGTPYDDFCDVYDSLWTEWKTEEEVYAEKECRAAAKKQLEFLRSLLEESKPEKS